MVQYRNYKVTLSRRQRFERESQILMTSPQKIGKKGKENDLGESFSCKYMDGNNVHTSVVIKLPDEEEHNGVNTYKIDVEDVEASKEYVIDQLFCDDGIAVYAVFEASDAVDGNSHRNLRKVSCSDLSEFRFSKRKSYLKKDKNTWGGKIGLMNSEENPDAHLEHVTNNSDRPLHYKIGNEKRNSPVLKKTEKCVKSDSTSRGVNTDIGQSPKLLEEVRKAVSLNFSKVNEKSTESSPVFSMKSSYEVRELLTRVGSITSGLDGDDDELAKKSPPNVVIVPVVIQDEEICNFWRDDKSQRSSVNESSGSKTSVVLEKVSVGTNIELSLLDHRSNKDLGTLQHKPDMTEKSDKEEENAKSQGHILEEIKKLQKKFNALLESLESTGFTFDGKKEAKVTEWNESTPNIKIMNKFEEVEVVSKEEKCHEEKTTNNEIEKKLESSRSNSGHFVKDVTDDNETADHKCDNEEKLNLINLIDWGEVETHKRVQLSKSQTNNYCHGNRSNNLKKSLSVDLEREGLGLKKLENIFFKLEGSRKKDKKKNLRNEEVELLDELVEGKLHELPKVESGAVKSKINYSTTNATPDTLCKTQKGKLNKSAEKGMTEKTSPNRINTKSSNIDSGDVKVIKKGSLKCKGPEKVKLETKMAPFQEAKEKVKAVNRRVSVKESPQARLHVDFLVKSHLKGEQKTNNLQKNNPTRLPRASTPKKDQKLVNKEKVGAEPATLPEESTVKTIKPKEMNNEDENLKRNHPVATSEIFVELFSKKPTSVENFHSEVDLQTLYNNNNNKAMAKEDRGCKKSHNSKDCENPVVKSVWALTKVLLYEDGTKKMEVLEASLNPPDYCFKQNFTDDKVR